MIFDDTGRSFSDQQLPSTSPADELDALAGEIARVAGHINAMDYHFIKLLDDFDERCGWVDEGVRSFAHWLNWKVGMNSMVAREKVRVARCLRTLPAIDAAFCTGAVSYSKVRAMTRVATPDNEEYLLQIATHGTTAHIEQLVKRYRQCESLEPTESDEYRDWKRQQSFTWFEDEDGMIIVRGRFHPEEGEVVAKALEKMIDRMYRERDETVKEAEAQLAEDEQNRRCVSAETDDDRSEDDRSEDVGMHPRNLYTKPQFQIDPAHAMIGIAEHFLATTEDGVKTLRPSDKYHILVHVNANAAHRDHKINGEDCTYIERGGFLAPEVVQRLACEASVTALVEGDEGHVLNIGRKSRAVPKAIDMAVNMRDDHRCRFPNCYQRRNTDKHHVIHWVDGGETSVENLITLCRYHHTRQHNGEYRIERDDGDFRFYWDDGREIVAGFAPQFPDNPEPTAALHQAERRHQDLGIHIDHNTIVPKWLGEPIDYDAAVEAMFNADKYGRRDAGSA